MTVTLETYTGAVTNTYTGAVTKATMLQAIDVARIFSITKIDGGRFFIEESCDCYYAVDLTKEQVLALADELRALAEG